MFKVTSSSEGPRLVHEMFGIMLEWIGPKSQFTKLNWLDTYMCTVIPLTKFLDRYVVTYKNYLYKPQKQIKSINETTAYNILNK